MNFLEPWLIFEACAWVVLIAVINIMMPNKKK